MRWPASNAARGVLLLLGLLIAARLAAMGLLPLMDTTEARYAEIGRKMVERWDWITPWADDGMPFWAKPPLSFWLTALSFKLFGINEFAARLPHFLCTAGVAGLTWRLAVRRSDTQGWLVLCLLVGSTLFYVSSGAVMTDAALVLGTTLAMAGFWGGLHGPAAQRQRERWWLFAGIAIGVLAKGPVALILIGLPLLGWTVIQRRAHAVWRAFAWTAGTTLVALLVVPWFVLAEWRTPGFLRYFLIGEHWHRFVTPGWQGDLYGTAHRYPPGTIWLFAAVALLPWSLLLPAAAWYRRGKPQPPGEATPDRSWQLYLLAWGLAPLLFFSAARNIIWTYVLPGVPALALLAAQALDRFPAPTRQRLLLAGLTLTLLGGLAFVFQLEGSNAAEQRSAKSLVAAYDRQHAADQPLVYIGTRPFSAAFYSRGRAARSESVARFAAALPSTVVYVAIRADHTAELKALASMRIDSVARYGLHDLVRLVHVAAAPAPVPDESAAPQVPAPSPSGRP